VGALDAGPDGHFGLTCRLGRLADRADRVDVRPRDAAGQADRQPDGLPGGVRARPFAGAGHVGNSGGLGQRADAQKEARLSSVGQACPGSGSSLRDGEAIPARESREARSLQDHRHRDPQEREGCCGGSAVGVLMDDSVPLLSAAQRLGEPAIASLLEPVLAAGFSGGLIHAIAFAVGFGIITFLHVVFGELAPRASPSPGPRGPPCSWRRS